MKLPKRFYQLSKRSGFTVFEILVVVMLISLSVIPLVSNARQTNNLQSIRTSASVFSDDLQEMRISSRDARSQSAWGVVFVDTSTYNLVFGTPQKFTVYKTKKLEGKTTFSNPFSVWFQIGTGNSASNTITLTNESNTKIDVSVSESGLIEIKQL